MSESDSSGDDEDAYNDQQQIDKVQLIQQNPKLTVQIPSKQKFASSISQSANRWKKEKEKASTETSKEEAGEAILKTMSPLAKLRLKFGVQITTDDPFQKSQMNKKPSKNSSSSHESLKSSKRSHSSSSLTESESTEKQQSPKLQNKQVQNKRPEIKQLTQQTISSDKSALSKLAQIVQTQQQYSDDKHASFIQAENVNLKNVMMAKLMKNSSIQNQIATAHISLEQYMPKKPQLKEQYAITRKGSIMLAHKLQSPAYAKMSNAVKKIKHGRLLQQIKEQVELGELEDEESALQSSAIKQMKIQESVALVQSRYSIGVQKSKTGRFDEMLKTFKNVTTFIDSKDIVSNSNPLNEELQNKKHQLIEEARRRNNLAMQQIRLMKQSNNRITSCIEAARETNKKRRLEAQLQKKRTFQLKDEVDAEIGFLNNIISNEAHNYNLNNAVIETDIYRNKNDLKTIRSYFEGCKPAEELEKQNIQFQIARDLACEDIPNTLETDDLYFQMEQALQNRHQLPLEVEQIQNEMHLQRNQDLQTLAERRTKLMNSLKGLCQKNKFYDDIFEIEKYSKKKKRQTSKSGFQKYTQQMEQFKQRSIDSLKHIRKTALQIIKQKDVVAMPNKKVLLQYFSNKKTIKEDKLTDLQQKQQEKDEQKDAKQFMIMITEPSPHIIASYQTQNQEHNKTIQNCNNNRRLTKSKQNLDEKFHIVNPITKKDTLITKKQSIINNIKNAQLENNLKQRFKDQFSKLRRRDESIQIETPFLSERNKNDFTQKYNRQGFMTRKQYITRQVRDKKFFHSIHNIVGRVKTLMDSTQEKSELNDCLSRGKLLQNAYSEVQIQDSIENEAEVKQKGIRRLSNLENILKDFDFNDPIRNSSYNNRLNMQFQKKVFKDVKRSQTNIVFNIK